MTILTWDTAGEFDAAQAESGVYHESVASTQHSSDTTIRKGAEYTTFPIADANIVAFYPCQEASGPTMTDISGVNGNGTYNGPLFQQQALLGNTHVSFDGGTDNATYPEVFTVSGSAFTVSAWTYWDSFTTSANDDLLACGNGGIEPLILRNDTAGNWEAVCNRVASTSLTVGSATSATTGQWVHLCVVYIQNDALYLYVNGAQADSAAELDNAGFSAAEVGENFFLASSQTGGSNADVKVADLIWWNTGLSGTQVSDLYDLYTAAGSYTSSAKSA